ncbi:MAG: ATP synthase F1 subunit delta [Clostridia bacterium]|nr:MAG: ATP synthase F1 subunit delta [Clostridia bacterium]
MNGQVGKRYARALFELAQEKGESAQVAVELDQIANLAATVPEMAAFLNSKRIGREEKKESITQLFRGKVSPLTLNFLYLLVDKGREVDLPAVERYFQKLWRESQGIVEGELTAAVPMAEEEKARLETELSRGLGRQVRLVARVDTALLGGLVVKIGDRVIDGSLRTRLERLRAEMVGG